MVELLGWKRRRRKKARNKGGLQPTPTKGRSWYQEGPCTREKAGVARSSRYCLVCRQDGMEQRLSVMFGTCRTERYSCSILCLVRAGQNGTKKLND